MIFQLEHFEELDWQPKINDKGSPNVQRVTTYIHFSSAQYLEAYSRCWHNFKLYTAANLASGCVSWKQLFLCHNWNSNLPKKEKSYFLRNNSNQPWSWWKYPWYLQLFCVCVSTYAYVFMNDVCDCVYSVCEWTCERRPDIRERNLLPLFSILLNWFFGNFMYVYKTFLSPSSVKHLPLISTSCIILYHQVCMLLPHLFICFLFNLALTEFTQGNLWGHECGSVHNIMSKLPLSQSVRRMTSSPAWPLTTV